MVSGGTAHGTGHRQPHTQRDFRYRLKAHTPLVKRPTQTIYQLVIECPRKASHPIRKWQEPGRCPKCADYLQRGTMPYREWDD